MFLTYGLSCVRSAWPNNSSRSVGKVSNPSIDCARVSEVQEVGIGPSQDVAARRVHGQQNTKHHHGLHEGAGQDLKYRDHHPSRCASTQYNETDLQYSYAVEPMQH